MKENEKPKLFSKEIKVVYSQDSDGNQDNEDEHQFLEISTEDCGGGIYLVLKTDRWAFDNIEELINLLHEFKKENER